MSKNVKTQNSHPNSDKQSDRFRELAREIGIDEESDRFDEVMRELAKKPPEPREKPKSDKK